MRVALLAAVLFLSVPFLSVSAAAPAPGAVDPDVVRLITSLGLVESPSPVRERQGWKRPQRIVVRRFRPDTEAWLQSVAPGVTLDVVDTSAQALAALPGADALLGFCEPPLVAAGNRLAWIQVYYAGVDRCVTTPAIAQRASRASDVMPR